MKKNVVAEIRRLFDADRFDQAYFLAQEAEQNGLVSPSLLVWKSRSLMLSELSDVSLNEVEESLIQALSIDAEYVPALTELGYFYLNVKDESGKAMPLFRAAFKILMEDASEVVCGLTECIAETSSVPEALDFLERHSFLTDAQETDRLRARLLT